MKNVQCIMRVFIFVCIFYIVHFTLVPMAFAHVLKTDGTIGAVLHIDPEDDPIAGQDASIFFEFKDTKNQFKVENCNFNVVITEDGQELSRQQLADSSSHIIYSFPHKGIYTVTVSGVPNNGSFQQFSLSYDVRVAREGTSTNTSPNHLPWITAGVLALGLPLALFFKLRHTKPRS
jgi:hypothetical protein